MTDTTARFLLPFILPGQAQKELFHNEGLVTVDMLLHPVVEEGPLDSPPSTPEEGQSWLVGTDPDGDWDDHADQLAIWTDAGWRFAVPTLGMAVWDATAGYSRRWTGSVWASSLAAATLEIGGVQVVGERQSAIVNPSGGTVIDVEARSAITDLIAALMSHGLIE